MRSTILFLSIFILLSVAGCGSILDVGSGRMVQSTIVPTSVASGTEDPCTTTTDPNSYIAVHAVGSPGNMITAFANANATTLNAATFYKVGCRESKTLEAAMGMAYGGNFYDRSRNDPGQKALTMVTKLIAKTAKEELAAQRGVQTSQPAPQPTASNTQPSAFRALGHIFGLVQ